MQGDGHKQIAILQVDREKLVASKGVSRSADVSSSSAPRTHPRVFPSYLVTGMIPETCVMAVIDPSEFKERFARVPTTEMIESAVDNV